jgi:hypothetical protein
VWIVGEAKRNEARASRDLELAQLSRRQLARRQVEEGEEGRIEVSDESEAGGQCNGTSRSASRKG